MASPLRNLQGVSYWVVENPRSIFDYINTNIRREWELDVKKAGGNTDADPWLMSLLDRTWTLEVVRLDEIRPDPLIMNYRDNGTGYDFQKELSKRRALLRKTLEYGSVIWPIIVDEKMMLRDGYCRYTTLAEIGVSETYCYLSGFRGPDQMVP